MAYTVPSRGTTLARRLLFVATMMAAATTAAADPDWQAIPVPGAWEKSGLHGTAAYDGHAWYRGWVMPHAECFSEHRSDLFRESVGLVVQGVADAHEVFINGQRIGTGGTLPPEFTSGRDMNLRHKIPAGVLQPNRWNEILIHVFNESDNGGFTTEPPMLVTYLKECRMAGPWEFRLGETAPAFGGPLAQRPATAAFDAFEEATTALGEAKVFETGPRLPPEESVKKFTTAPDLVFEQLLYEPLVAQPVHFSFDGRGRLWVANYRQYPYPAGVKVLSRDKYYRSVFDKMPPAPPDHDKGRDSVTIHEDTDGDGRYDRHAVFLDGLNMVTSARGDTAVSGCSILPISSSMRMPTETTCPTAIRWCTSADSVSKTPMPRPTRSRGAPTDGSTAARGAPRRAG